MATENEKITSSSERWSTYEANVQAYRSNMIASQSFLLTVGAVLLDKDVYLLGVCVTMALFQLWYIWFRVIRVRTIIVDYHKFRLDTLYSDTGERLQGEQAPLREETYVKRRRIRKKVNEKLAEDKKNPKLKHNLRHTRVKLDLIIPITFTVIWVSLLVYKALGLVA